MRKLKLENGRTLELDIRQEAEKEFMEAEVSHLVCEAMALHFNKHESELRLGIDTLVELPSGHLLLMTVVALDEIKIGVEFLCMVSPDNLLDI